MVDLALTDADLDALTLPSRFAGLAPEAAPPPANPPRPHGDLTSAAIEEIEQVVRRVWPGRDDAVRRRGRGARSLLAHLDELRRIELAAAVGGQRPQRAGALRDHTGVQTKRA